MISSKSHCALVAVKDDEIVGTLLAATTQNMWAQRQACGIALWVCKVPVLMKTLLQEFKVWVKPRRAIKVAGLCPDIDCQDSVWSLAERIGFVKHGGSYLLYN